MLLQRPAKRGALFNLNEMFEMKENLILVNYKVESEAYQALSEMKHETTNANYTISQAVIIKKYREEDASPEIRELKREVESKKAVLQKRRALFPKL